jgi:hypothetical protein
VTLVTCPSTGTGSTEGTTETGNHLTAWAAGSARRHHLRRAACLGRQLLAVSRVDQRDWAMAEAIRAIPAAVATEPEGAR